MDIYDPWKLNDVFTQHYQEMITSRNHVLPGHAHIPPSGLAGMLGKCNRFLGYKAIGQPPKAMFTPQQQRRMALGQVVHKYKQNLLKEIYGDRVQFEVPFTIADLQMRGKADGALDDVCGLEIKPISKTEFLQEPIRGEARAEDKIQIAFYFIGLAWETCTLYYISTDGWTDDSVVVLTRDYAVPLYKKYHQRITEEVLAVVAKGEAPLPHRGSHCLRCEYYEPCSHDQFGD